MRLLLEGARTACGDLVSRARLFQVVGRRGSRRKRRRRERQRLLAPGVTVHDRPNAAPYEEQRARIRGGDAARVPHEGSPKSVDTEDFSVTRDESQLCYNAANVGRACRDGAAQMP